MLLVAPVRRERVVWMVHLAGPAQSVLQERKAIVASLVFRVVREHPAVTERTVCREELEVLDVTERMGPKVTLGPPAGMVHRAVTASTALRVMRAGQELLDLMAQLADRAMMGDQDQMGFRELPERRVYRAVMVARA